MARVAMPFSSSSCSTNSVPPADSFHFQTAVSSRPCFQKIVLSCREIEASLKPAGGKTRVGKASQPERVPRVVSYHVGIKDTVVNVQPGESHVGKAPG